MKILLICVKWLRFTGIISSSGAPAWNPKMRKPVVSAAPDWLLCRHFIIATAVLVPQVMTNAFFYDL